MTSSHIKEDTVEKDICTMFVMVEFDKAQEETNWPRKRNRENSGIGVCVGLKDSILSC